MIRTWSEYVELKDIAKVVGEIVEADSVTEPSIIGMLNGEPVFEVNARVWGDIDNLFTSIWVNAYGFVDRRKDDELYQLPYNKECVKLIKLFKDATSGIKIEGRTYVEAFKEVHYNSKKNMIDEEVDKLERKRAKLINDGIRISGKIDEFLEDAGISK